MKNWRWADIVLLIVLIILVAIWLYIVAETRDPAYLFMCCMGAIMVGIVVVVISSFYDDMCDHELGMRVVILVALLLIVWVTAASMGAHCREMYECV